MSMGFTDGDLEKLPPDGSFVSAVGAQGHYYVIWRTAKRKGAWYCFCAYHMWGNKAAPVLFVVYSPTGIGTAIDDKDDIWRIAKPTVEIPDELRPKNFDNMLREIAGLVQCKDDLDRNVLGDIIISFAEHLLTHPTREQIIDGYSIRVPNKVEATLETENTPIAGGEMELDVLGGYRRLS